MKRLTLISLMLLAKLHIKSAKIIAIILNNFFKLELGNTK